MAVTSVVLGNFFTNSDGKLVLGGAGGSGLDTQALIKSLVAAKSAPVIADQDLIKVNDGKSTALSSFNSLLTAFQKAADALRSPPGVGNAASDAFRFTTATVGNGGSAYVSVTTQPGAALQSYNISDITSIASSANQGTGTFNLASADTDATVNPGSGSYFDTGTIHFNGADITVNSGDSLNNIAASFNAVKGTTGVTASVISVDSTHYRLSFVATKTGDSHNFDLTGATNFAGVMSHVGVTGVTSGTNAAFKLNDIAIIRQSNSISDVINDVTFNILQTTPDGVTNYPVTISPDTTTVQNTINVFVSNYNALKTFAAQQTQLNADGTYASTSVLVNDQTFRQTMDNINQQVLSLVAGIGGGALSSLADLGITLTNQAATSTTPEVDNVLTVNDGQLTSALSSNFDQVKNLFGFNFTSDNPNLAVFTHTNALAATAFTLTINPGTSTFRATFAGLDPVDFTATALAGGSGYSLVGPAGSVLDGLQLIYASTSNATIHVTATKGIADQAYNSTNAATKANTGTIAVALTAFKTSDTTLNEDITRQNQLLSQYQTQLTKQFAALEQAISRSNTLLQSLSANSNAALIASGR